MISLENLNCNGCVNCGKLPTVGHAVALNGKYSMWHECEEIGTYTEWRNDFDSVPKAVDAWNSINKPHVCVSHIAKSFEGQAFVIYLADGNKINVGRNRHTSGPAWLEIQATPIIKAGILTAKKEI